MAGERGVEAPGHTLRGIRRKQAPAIAYVLLTASILAVSSAALAFRKLDDVAPLTLAAWRLQATALVLLPGFAWQTLHAPPELRANLLQSWWLLMTSGACLALHFGAWVWGLQHTSLPHALLFVTATPLLIAGGALALREPISRGEIGGAVAGLVGMAILCLGARTDKQVTVAGDLASLLGAAAMVGHLHVGASVRAWAPLFCYALPVTATGAAILTLLGAVAEGARPAVAGAAGAAGYLASAHHARVVAYLALVPGLVGHTGFNALLRVLSPLVISMALTLEPLVGSVMAWAAGEAAVPGASTWLGGAVVTAALMACSASEARRVAARQKRHAVVRATALEDEKSVELGAFTIADEAEGHEDEFLIDRD